MRTNDRIDELLRQKAKIWGIGKQGNVFCVGLKFRPETLKNKKWLENKYEVYSKFFETEEEAKWFAEFGCIERTERLELPTWEEFSKWDKSIKFSNNSTKYSMYVFVKNKNTKNCRIIIYADNGEQDWFVFEQPLTQENYTLACRKAKELFLGEKK